MEQFILFFLVVPVTEDPLDSAHTAQHTLAVCILIHMWDGPGAFPSGGHIVCWTL